MATKTGYKKLLSSTEQQAIEKLLKMRQPMIREMEKWTEQRDQLETKILDHLDTIGKMLEPYYKQSHRWGKTLLKATAHSTSSRHPNKKASSRKKSSSKKSRSR